MSEAGILGKVCLRWALQNGLQFCCFLPSHLQCLCSSCLPVRKHHSRSGFPLWMWCLATIQSPFSHSAHPLCLWLKVCLPLGMFHPVYGDFLYCIYCLHIGIGKVSAPEILWKFFQIKPEFVIGNLLVREFQPFKRIQMSSDLSDPRTWRNTAKWKAGLVWNSVTLFPCVCHLDRVSGF